MSLSVALYSTGSKEDGVSIAAKGTEAALTSVGATVIRCDLAAPESWAAGARAQISILHANPNAISREVSDPRLLAAAVAGRPVVGYWVWEAPGVPAFWERWLPIVDSLWVPSRFVAGALDGRTGLPVAVVPHPISPPPPTFSRTELQLPADRFLFLFMFNARSNFGRKNPAGLIDAYRRAFPEEDGASMLILKSVDMTPEEALALDGFIGGRRDIAIVNRQLDEDRTASLIAACDCYVSLHRAEGFGLTVAEAMYFGRPVICTGYSGVMDFAGADTAYLVDYELGRLTSRHGIFPAGTQFAEPDLGQAAALMRHVMGARDEAAERGRRAAATIASRFAPERVGRRMRALIEARLEGDRTG